MRTSLSLAYSYEEGNRTFGASKESQKLDNTIDEALTSVFTTHETECLLSELHRVATETSEPDWDGYGAQPFNNGAFLDIKRLIPRLPKYIDLPEIEVHPDGSIGLVWMKGNDCTASVALDGRGYIFYSALRLNGERERGKQLFSGHLPLVVTIFLAKHFARPV